jgi:hypothetical protein
LETELALTPMMDGDRSPCAVFTTAPSWRPRGSRDPRRRHDCVFSGRAAGSRQPEGREDREIRIVAARPGRFEGNEGLGLFRPHLLRFPLLIPHVSPSVAIPILRN